MNQKATVRKLLLSKSVYVLLFVVGAVAFLYPLVSNILNYRAQTRVIYDYTAEVAAFDEATLVSKRESARIYNEYIAGLEGYVTDDLLDTERDASSVVYMSTLNVGPSMGFITIPKIDVKLPIYHGDGDDVLSIGVGHMERSSLPIGGESTHTVLVGHRGLPTSHMFRDLGLLEVGDLFFIDTLDERLAYEVESIKIVLPAEATSLQVQEDRDLATLITCEPYMINSHRLLVTGHRTEYVEDMAENVEGRITFFQKYWEYFLIVAVFVLLLILTILVQRQYRKHIEST